MSAAPMLGLAILGLSVLGLVLVIVYAFRDASRRASKIVQRIAERVPVRPTLNLTDFPPRVELVPCVDIPWSDPTEVVSYAERLRALGFQDAGRYQILQLPDRYLWAFVKPEAGVTVVLTRTRASASFEMATHYSNGTSFAFGSSRTYGLLTHPPHWTVQAVPESDPASVFEQMLAERPERPVAPDQVDDFVAKYQDRYARIMDWRNLRGGYTEEEIRAISAAVGVNPTDEMVADCRQRVAERALRDLEEPLQEAFFTQAQLSDEEAEALLPWMAVVHDRLDFDMLVPAFAGRWVSAHDTLMPEPCPLAEEIRTLDKPSRAAFALLNERMPGPKFQLVGQVTEPLEADIYVGHDAPLPSRMRPATVPE
jgi:hypothetical protein